MEVLSLNLIGFHLLKWFKDCCSFIQHHLMSLTENSTETFAFSADINQLLSLIINTFYSNKDIFLRELISNASDALDKIRYKSLTNPELLGDNPDLEVKIETDLVNKQLIIRDYGIGMTKEELINNLGTIAKSGTKAFMEAIQSGEDSSLIGQFGVGFYSAFLVADTVEVHSKSNDSDEQFVWTSTAGGSFTIEPKSETDEDLGRGTKLVLHMKDDMLNYLQDETLKKLVRKHSDFIGFLIKLRVEKVEEKEVTDDEVETEVVEVDNPTDDTEVAVAEAEEVDKSTDDTEVAEADEVDKPNKDVEVADGAVDDNGSDSDSDEPKKKTKKIQVHHTEWEPLNHQRPLWTRKPSEVTEEEYGTFYKAVANDYEGHLAVKHFSVEGQIEFKSILFVPLRAPFDLYDNGMKKMDNIKLYVRRVFIMDRIENLMPQYLCFVKGVVDSEDLPLNISRETLQQTKVIKVIRKHLIKKSLDMLESIAEDERKYKLFYENFGKTIKLGIHEDQANKDKLARLLRFPSANNKEDLVSLAQYVEQMKDTQKGIYYITGESISSVETSPFVEKVRSHGYNVLYMTDPMDEYCMNQLKDFDDKPLVCITKEGLDLGEDEETKKAFEERAQALQPLCEKMKEVLGEAVEKVVPSPRLETSPCVLVTGMFGWTANMERLVKAQALQNNSTQMQSQFMACRKTMEIHPDHPIICKLESIVGDDEKSGTFRDIVRLMFETTLISSGFTLEEPSKYAGRINRLVAMGLEVDNLEEWLATRKGVESATVEIPDVVTDDPVEGVVEEESTMEEVD